MPDQRQRRRERRIEARHDAQVAAARRDLHGPDGVRGVVGSGPDGADIGLLPRFSSRLSLPSRVFLGRQHGAILILDGEGDAVIGHDAGQNAFLFGRVGDERVDHVGRGETVDDARFLLALGSSLRGTVKAALVGRQVAGDGVHDVLAQGGVPAVAQRQLVLFALGFGGDFRA